MKILLMPCVFVYKFFKYSFNGLLFFITLPIKLFTKGKDDELEETASIRRKIERKQRKLEQQQIRLEAKRIKHEKRIEAKKIKEQKKLQAQIEKQKIQTQERSKRLKESLIKVEEEAKKRSELNAIREAKDKERRRIKEEKNRKAREKKLKIKLEKANKKAEARALKEQQKREKYAVIYAKKEEARLAKEQVKRIKEANQEELERIKNEQKEIERQKKIAQIREKTRINEEESYHTVKDKEARKLAKLRKKEEKMEAKKARIQARKDAKNALKKAKNDKNADYVNKDVKIEKPSILSKISSIFKNLKSLPGKMVSKIKNNSFAKNARNKRDINRQALLIDFEGDDAKKSDVKLLYEYEAKDSEGKFVKGYFEAYSRVEVHSFLLSEGYEVYSIKTNKWITFLHGGASVNRVKFKNKDLIFFLTQLSTYLKAGITLSEALKILSRQFAKTKKYEKIFKSIIYELTMGESFSSALEKQNVAFPKLLINMIKTAEMTGELPEVLDNMVDYYTEIDETKRQFVTAMTYPTIVFIFAMGVITFILIYVVPKFVDLYDMMDGSQIPKFTLIVMGVSNFLKNSYMWVILLIIAFITIYIILYKKLRFFKTINQWVLMHIPVVGSTIIYSEVATFTKTFSSLLSHNVPITECMEILNKITNNEIYKMLILDVVSNLAKGGKVSDAFDGHWAFPIPAYEMICTGERTGELPDMLNKVSIYYQSLQKNSVTRIKTFIEPILTVFLTVIVGTIILAVIIPMFNLYQSVQAPSTGGVL